MKYLILLITICWMLTGTAVAQKQHNEVKHYERMKEFKMQVISEHLALSSEDSTKFWPVFEEFEGEMESIRREMMDMTKGLVAKSDKQLEKDIERMFELKTQQLAIEQKYYTRFKEVISIRQIAALYQAENQIKRMILNRLKEHKRERRHGEGRF